MRTRIREEHHSVYALLDPRDSAVKYIGIAADIHRRLNQHARWEYSPNTARGQWLEELRRQGMEPIMRVLESDLSLTRAYEREQYWIHQFLSTGAPLKNTAIRRNRPEQQWTIYALIDPRDGTVRYVGTAKNMHTRLIQHINDKRKNSKGLWVAELRCLGLAPELKILETIGLDGSEEDDIETAAKTRVQYWIYKHVQAGAPLLNAAGVTRNYPRFTARLRSTGAKAITNSGCSPLMTLTEYRENLGWSRAELAREAKLDYQTVSKAENGEQITGRSARAIADALSKALGTSIKLQDINGLNVKA